MKPFKRVDWIIGGLIFVLFMSYELGASTTRDYGLHCMKCLAHRHACEYRFFGITYWRTATPLEIRPDYERLFGHPCNHVFRQMGLGQGTRLMGGFIIGCGDSAEGMYVAPRRNALRAMYDIEDRLPDRALAMETFQLMDEIMPPDAPVPKRSYMWDVVAEPCNTLAAGLPHATTVEDWRDVLRATRRTFAKASELANEVSSSQGPEVSNPK